MVALALRIVSVARTYTTCSGKDRDAGGSFLQYLGPLRVEREGPSVSGLIVKTLGT